MAVETPLAPAPRRVVDTRRHARRGWLLLGVAAWNVWLWVTRTMNLLGDTTPRSTGFVVVHVLLYGASFLIAGGLAVMGWRMLREARQMREQGG